MIWEATLDNKYRCWVDRRSEYLGQLNIAIGKVVVHSEDVYLSYGAQFGPDAGDVSRWQQICSDYVDKKKQPLK